MSAYEKKKTITGLEHFSTFYIELKGVPKVGQLLFFQLSNVYYINGEYIYRLRAKGLRFDHFALKELSLIIFLWWYHICIDKNRLDRLS